MSRRRKAKVKVTRRTTTVRTPAGASRRSSRRGKSSLRSDKHMVLSFGSSKVTVQFSPREVTLGGFSRKWEEVEEKGKAYMFDRGPGIPTLSFDVIVASGQGNSVQSQLDRLKSVAKTKEVVRINYSKLESGTWHVTNMTIRSVHRHPRTQEVIWAEVSIELASAAKVNRNKTPTEKAQARKDAKAKKKTSPLKTKNAKTVKHKVKRGDTLTSISQQYRGTSAYADIARANGIKDPSVLPFGRTFNIPMPPEADSRRSNGRGD